MYSLVPRPSVCFSPPAVYGEAMQLHPSGNEIQDLLTANPRMLPNRVNSMTTVNMMSFITEHYHQITDNTGKRRGHWLHVA